MPQHMVSRSYCIRPGKLFTHEYQGFRSSLGTLDSVTEHLPRDGPVIIVTASFEGMCIII
jgi:hypothetical protein